MIRPALAKPTFSLRCSIDVDPSWLRTTSSIAWRIIASSSSSPPAEKALALEVTWSSVSGPSPPSTPLT